MRKLLISQDSLSHVMLLELRRLQRLFRALRSALNDWKVLLAVVFSHEFLQLVVYALSFCVLHSFFDATRLGTNLLHNGFASLYVAYVGPVCNICESASLTEGVVLGDLEVLLVPERSIHQLFIVLI